MNSLRVAQGSWSQSDPRGAHAPARKRMGRGSFVMVQRPNAYSTAPDPGESSSRRWSRKGSLLAGEGWSVSKRPHSRKGSMPNAVRNEPDGRLAHLPYPGAGG